MKLTKGDLKQIVKECLVEILRDGIGGLSTKQISSDDILGPSSSFSESSAKSNSRRIPTSQLGNAIKREAGGNKLMESIFADTAASTLPKMLGGEQRGHVPQSGGVAEQIVASADPEQLFGEEAASKWANLAFVGTSLKK